LAKAFRLGHVPTLIARYNIAPTQDAPVIRTPSRREREINPQTNERRIDLLHWGLIPSWADDPKVGNRMINARAESAAQTPAFRNAFRRRRCLIPADGFFEWHKIEPAKQPYFIRMRDGHPFAFAGLWEVWHGKENEQIESFTILTTEPNELAGRFHDRMPAILPPEAYDAWLDPKQEDVEFLKGLLKPADASAMEAYAVSRRVNKAEYDQPDCVQPVLPEEPPAGLEKRRGSRPKLDEGELLF